MWLPSTLISFILFLSFHRESFAYPNTRRDHLTREAPKAEHGWSVRYRDSEGSIKTLSPPSKLNKQPTTALSIRSAPNYGKRNVTFTDLKFLIPSQNHLNLLHQIYSEMLTAADNALQTTMDTPAKEITFMYGFIVLNVVCGRKFVSLRRLLFAAAEFIDNYLLVLHPISFSLFALGTDGIIWAWLALGGELPAV
ncbi:hypothetical protein ACLMJK_008771 [Lecanora helva]